MNRPRDQVEIIASRLRSDGKQVCVTRNIGGGFPHLLIGAHRQMCLAFVRNSTLDLTDEEREFKRTWWNHPVLILSNADQAVREVGRWLEQFSARRP